MRLRFLVALLASCGARSQLDVAVDATKPCNSGQCCGHAVSFDVGGDDVRLVGVNVVPSSGFTWDFWFNADALPTSSDVDVHAGATMLITGDDVGCEDIYVGFGSEHSPANELAFNLDGFGGCDARDSTPIQAHAAFAPGQWYFLAVSHDYATGDSKLYVDGTLVANKTASVQPIPRTMPVLLGRWTDGTTTQFDYNHFRGAIDELHIYARALTAAEVSSEYGSGAGLYGGVSGAALAGYHFDEGSGAAAANYLGALAGTLESTATWVPGFICAR